MHTATLCSRSVLLLRLLAVDRFCKPSRSLESLPLHGGGYCEVDAHDLPTAEAVLKLAKIIDAKFCMSAGLIAFMCSCVHTKSIRTSTWMTTRLNQLLNAACRRKYQLQLAQCPTPRYAFRRILKSRAVCFVKYSALVGGTFRGRLIRYIQCLVHLYYFIYLFVQKRSVGVNIFLFKILLRCKCEFNIDRLLSIQ